MRVFCTFGVAILIATGLSSCSKNAGQANRSAAAGNEESGEVASAASAGDGPEVAPVETPSGTVTFFSALSLTQKGNSVEPQLRHATVATPGDFQASFYTTFATTGGEASCTSVLIGPQVLLTAAHCIPQSKVVDYSFQGAAPLPAHCTRDPKWESGDDLSADFALCRLDAAFQAPAGFKYETVDTEQLDPDAHALPLMLTGFGCTGDSVKNETYDKLYRFGYALVVASSLSKSTTYGPRYYAAHGQANNLFTEPAGANLCPGDSGGPAFKSSDTANDRQHVRRQLVGINSRVFFADANHNQYGASMISGLGFGEFRPWAMDWLTKNGTLAACGMTGSLPNCRT